MAIATFDGICRKCNKPYQAGDRILFFNKPVARSPYHLECVKREETPDWTQDQPIPHTVPPVNHKAYNDPPESVNVKPNPSPVPKRATSDALLDIITEAVSERISLEGLTDEAKVREIASEEASRAVDAATDKAVETLKATVNDLAPRVTVIELRRPDALPVAIEGAHYLMPRLLRLMGAGIHVYLWGPPGSGKTTAALQAAKALGLDAELDTLDASTPKSHILGYRNLDKSPAETAFSRAYPTNAVYVADETDNASAGVQTLFNSALANHRAPFAWGMLDRGERFVFTGTGNTPGRKTPMFPDRHPMSAAFADRLYFIHWPLDPAIEQRAAGLPLSAPPYRREYTCTPAVWGKWVQDVRAYAASAAPTLMVTPRATLTGLQALAIGETPEEVAHGLVFRGADSALVGKILSEVSLP
jgi:hypothetical protein